MTNVWQYTHTPRLVFHLLQWDETRRVGGTNAGTAVAHWAVTDGELAKVVANHGGLDLYGGEALAVVHTNNTADHLWHHNHVTQVSVHALGLLTASLLLGGTQLLDQVAGLLTQTTGHAAAGTSGQQCNQLLGWQAQQSLQVVSAVRELAEGTAAPWLTLGFRAHDNES